MPNGTSGGVGGSEVQTRSLPDCSTFPAVGAVAFLHLQLCGASLLILPQTFLRVLRVVDPSKAGDSTFTTQLLDHGFEFEVPSQKLGRFTFP